MATLVNHPQDTPRDPASFSPEQDIIPAKISAYYSLVFPSFTYYLQTLNVTIGRRCIPANTASSSDNPQVDVDLGPLKSVSRLHAKIEYEEEEERFVLIVVGRNGAWVDGVWSGSGSKVPLNDRCVHCMCDIELVSLFVLQVTDPDRFSDLSLHPSAASCAGRLPVTKFKFIRQPRSLAVTLTRHCRRYLYIPTILHSTLFPAPSGCPCLAVIAHKYTPIIGGFIT